MKNYKEYANSYINRVIETLKKIDTQAISNVINVLLRTLENDGVVYVLGNGGSAATASHIQNDFNFGISKHYSKKFKVFCLSDNVATITAIANDLSYDDIYSQQLQGRLSKNDLVIAISGRGNSQNVIKAVMYAKSLNIPIIGITGFDGGKLFNLADYNLHVDVDDMQITEDLHLLFNHLIVSALTT